jgi:PAS domain S-box-containing protein
MNPAYMTRQVHETAEGEYGLRGHIRSLNPINPSNVPDPWETKALKAFEAGAKEFSSVEKMDDIDFMRLMRPLMTESACLKCHSKQGDKLGQLRGGISVSVPMAPLQAAASTHMLQLAVGHCLLWLLGLGGINLGGRRLKQRITERDTAQHELKHSEERYVLAQRAANIGSWDWNILTNELAWSDQIEPMFGFEKGKFEGTYQAFLNCVHPEDRKLIIDSVQACTTQGSDYNIEHRIIWPDGTVRWVTEIGDVIRDRNQKAIRMLGIVRDITYHKEAVNQAESLAKFPSENPNPVLRVTKQGLLLYANDASKPILQQWNCEVGQTVPDKWCRTVSDVYASKTSRRVEVEYSKTVYAFVMVPVTEPGYVNFYGRDITEQKKNREALRESEERYRNVYDTAPLAFVVWDTESRITGWNKSAEHIFGWSQQEVIGKNLFDFLIPESERPHVGTVVKSLLQGDLPSQSINSNLTKSGKTIFCAWNNSILRDAYGQVVGAMSMALDITEQKKAEEDLNRYRIHLEELVENRTEELTKTNEQLLREIEQRKNLEREILDISEREQRRLGQELHDSLGQQLTGIAFLTKVLEKKLTTNSAQASDAADITRLINQATDQTRSLARGMSPIYLKDGSLAWPLQELAEHTEKLFDIKCSFESQGQVELGDPSAAIHLYRITQEAITNAIKHGKTNNIQIILKSETPQSVLMIENDGIDFPKEFEARGTGLGLQIMDHRVDIIGGSLTITHRQQGGTIVTCVFPNEKADNDTEEKT